jgi:hypothetical protein
MDVKNTFLPSFLLFYRPVALLCGSKKAKMSAKILFLSSHQIFLNNFIYSAQ